LDPANKTWTAWKTAYFAAHKKRANRLRATGGADYLGRANSVYTTTLNPSLLDSINNAFDNLISAASNRKAILEQLIASNSSLATSNSNLTNQVKTLHDQLAAKSRGGGGRGAGSNDPNKRRGPDPDGYRWSQDYPIGHGHTGHTCSHLGWEIRLEFHGIPRLILFQTFSTPEFSLEFYFSDRKMCFRQF
jgi:hypothetical protein